MKLVIPIHSFVDVITNSSTVIFTYQNSVEQAKKLIQEVLKLSGVNESVDDLFYFGVFCDDDIYLESDDLPKDCPKWKSGSNEQDEWMEKLRLSIMKGEIKQPEWMDEREEDSGDSWNPNTYLHIVSKNSTYDTLILKIKALLNSPSSDGGRDG